VCVFVCVCVEQAHLTLVKEKNVKRTTKNGGMSRTTNRRFMKMSHVHFMFIFGVENVDDRFF